jgi:putative cell wall-binding protein
MFSGISDGRMGRVLASISAALLFALVLAVGPTASRADATTAGVSNETEFRAALAAMTDDSSGDHFINITADFSVSETAGDPYYDGTDSLTINGNGHTVTGTHDAAVGFLYFNALYTTLTLNDITIAGFEGVAVGGAIFAPAGDVVVNHSTFAGNTATWTAGSWGGAIYTDTGSVTVTNSTFTGNSAQPLTGGQFASGGAIFAGQGNVTVIGSTFTGNYADNWGGPAEGGAITSYGSISVTDSTFDSNYVTGADPDTVSVGGAILAVYATANLSGSTFVGNHVSSSGGSTFGGAVYLAEGGTVTNTTFVNNSATATGGTASGGGLAAEVTTGLNHVTAKSNHADDAGANFFAYSAVLRFFASVVVDPSGASNCGFEVGGSSTSGGYNFLSDTSCFAVGGTDVMAADPGLGALADNGGPTKTMEPTSASSPVVDAIPAASCRVGVDQRGVYRPSQGACDIGAVELLQNDAGLVVRLSGPGRYETAAAISNYHHPFGAANVYVSTGSNFPDALAGAAAAARDGAPLLLTGSTMPSATSLEMHRLNLMGTLTGATLLGGTSVVTPEVDSALTGLGLATTRLSGSNRYETAVAISQNSYPKGAPIVFVATGSGFADALAGGPAAAHLGGPVLLTSYDSVPKSVSDEIARLAPPTIVVLGGTAVVSDAVYTELQGMATTTVRLAGANRYETAVAISRYAFPTPADVNQVYIATGANFPDALAGAAEASAKGVPILLTESASLPSNVADEIDRLGVSTIYVLGGTGVVSDAVATALTGHIK